MKRHKKDGTDVRTLYLQFLFGLLQDEDVSVAEELLDTKVMPKADALLTSKFQGTVSIVLKQLDKDKPETLQYLINGLTRSVVRRPLVKRLKMNVFSSAVLGEFATLLHHVGLDFDFKSLTMFNRQMSRL